MKKSLLIGALVLSILLLFTASLISFKVGFDIAKEIAENNNSIINTGKLRAMECPESYRGQNFCTKEYIPVCGWYNASKVQCAKYPCAINAGNVCEACSNEDVEYYTEGLCPSEEDGKLI